MARFEMGVEHASGEVVGYVVVDWNQASGAPDVDFGLYLSREDATEEAEDRQAKTNAIGRRERHTVAAVIELED